MNTIRNLIDEIIHLDATASYIASDLGRYDDDTLEGMCREVLRKKREPQSRRKELLRELRREIETAKDEANGLS